MAHILLTLTDVDFEVAIVSIDGVGAYDSVLSRNAMLEGFLRMEDGERVFPFVRRFYGSPSICIWKISWEFRARLDGRRLEVVADGLTLWGGAQLAIDTTLVSPFHQDGSPPQQNTVGKANVGGRGVPRYLVCWGHGS